MDILRIKCIAGRKSATVERRNHRESIGRATRNQVLMILRLNQLLWVVVTISKTRRGEWHSLSKEPGGGE
jgi:hypothetical protein